MEKKCEIRMSRMRNGVRLAGLLGWQDLLQTYRRSALGPFWLTAGMAVQIAVIGVVFGMIFKTDLTSYLPLVATGIIFWGYITNSLNESSLAFISAESIIRQLPLPAYVHTLRVSWKNLLVLGHNLAILPVAYLAVGKSLDWAMLFLIPGLVLVSMNLSWIGFILATVSARYRDVPPLIQAFLVVGFYVTPVMWSPDLLPAGLAHFLLGLNPLYHLLQIVRLPAMGQYPTVENWILSMLLLLTGAVITALVSKKYSKKIAFWV